MEKMFFFLIKNFQQRPIHLLLACCYMRRGVNPWNEKNDTVHFWRNRCVKSQDQVSQICKFCPEGDAQSWVKRAFSFCNLLQGLFSKLKTFSFPSYYKLCPLVFKLKEVQVTMHVQKGVERQTRFSIFKFSVFKLWEPANHGINQIVGKNLRIVAQWGTFCESHLLRLYFSIFSNFQ